MRTTSVNSAIPADAGSVIVFPRRKTIGIQSSELGLPHSGNSGSASLVQFKPSPVSRTPGSELDRTASSSDHEAETDRHNVPSDLLDLPLVQTSSAMFLQHDDPVLAPVVAGSQMFLSLAAGMAIHAGPFHHAGPFKDVSGSAHCNTPHDSPAVMHHPAASLDTNGGAGTIIESFSRINEPASISPEAVRKAAVARLVSVHDQNGNGSTASDLASALSAVQPERKVESLLERKGGLMPNGHDAAAPVQVSETGQYIAQMAQELARMARGSRLDLLAYFLDMAELEARMHSTIGVQRA